MRNKIISSEKGQGLAETAIVLGVFILILLGLFDFYNVQTMNHQLYLGARNIAWKKSGQGFWDRLWDNMEGVGSDQGLADLIMDVNHAQKDTTLDSTLYILPPLTLKYNFYIDRNTWDKDLSVGGLIGKLKRKFGVGK